MNVTVEEPAERQVVIHVAGPLSGDEAPTLRSEVKPLMGDGRRLVLDLAGVRSWDFNGIAVLVSITRRVRNAGGELRLANRCASLDRLLEATGLDRVLSLC